MSKKILLKNTTGAIIEIVELGVSVPVFAGSPALMLDLSYLPSVVLRRVDFLATMINDGSIIINDGAFDLPTEEAITFINDDVTADIDGFWYANRRRFGFIINQTAHGFLPGQVVYLNDFGTALLADANNVTTCATSFIVTEVIDVDNFYAAGFGAVCIPDPSTLDAGLPLTVGRGYFLSIINPGNLTLILPTKNKEVVKLVARATSTTELLIFNYPGYTNQTK